MTVTPAAANRGAWRAGGRGARREDRDVQPGGSAVAASSTVIWRPCHSMTRPAERDEANSRRSCTGNARSASTAQDDAAHLAGRADHPEVDGAVHRPVPP